MTHLSDFSFLQRAVSFSYLYIWYIHRVWTLDRFSCLHPKRFQQGELKSIVTLLILFMIPFQLFYDATSVKIKYEEGFANVLGHIFTKPEQMWTKADRNLVIPTEYSLVIGFSFQTGTLALLQCFWNYLSNSVANTSFMSSREFMFYLCWTLSSFIIFPLLQYNFSRNIYEPTYKEIVPEMVYGIEIFIVACLGVVSHFRFKKLLTRSRNTVDGRSITQKVRYFQEVNIVLSATLFIHGALLTILSCDGLTNSKYLNIHKFSADFFICNINTCAVITWLCMILIFHPKNNTPLEPTHQTEQSTYNYDNRRESDIYGHASTFTTGSSQMCSDYTYKTSHSPSKNGTMLDNNYCEGGLQYGPLPLIPSQIDAAGIRSSASSTAHSVSTLVSSRHHHEADYESSQKSGLCSQSARGSIRKSNPSFKTADPCERTPSFNTSNDFYSSDVDFNAFMKAKAKQHQNIEPSEIRAIRVHSTLKANHPLKEIYVQPPLSPPRKSRDATQSLSLEKNRRCYSHSLRATPCNESLDEFGTNTRTSSLIIDDLLISNVSSKSGEHVPSDTIDSFQPVSIKSKVAAREQYLNP